VDANLAEERLPILAQKPPIFQRLAGGRLEAPGPGSLDPFVGLAPGLDGLTEVPHLVLGEVVFKLRKELEDLLVAGEVVLLLFEPPQVVLNIRKNDDDHGYGVVDLDLDSQ
jgi:hypothetical protein